MKVAIIKYNAGNVYSVYYALKRLGIEAELTDDKNILSTADKVIFPGVGEAQTTMQYLRNRQLDQLIQSIKQPVLGICLGMQLMCRHSEEGNAEGLNIFPTDVLLFKPNNNEKVPHMGWNTIKPTNDPLMKGIQASDYVYFVHSYYVPMCPYTIAQTDYVQPFSAALHKDNFYATQFHPEKSGKIGEQILENFLNLQI